MNKVIKPEGLNAVTTNDDTATDNILAAAQEEAGFEKILKFRKGEYVINEELIPLGTEYLAHAEAWTKCWIKFLDGNVADRKIYRVARGERPPERDELDDSNPTEWPKKDGKPADPWVYQYLLPLENLATGDIVIFTTPSIGGRIAVADLAKAFANRGKNGRAGQPIVKLETAEMPTKNYGKVPRPVFQIVGWDDAASTVDIPEVSAETEMDDEILF